jgi:dienelactone hydrolase
VGATALGPSAAAASDVASGPPPQAHLGSIYPFVAGQVGASGPSLSFLRPEFRDAAAWRRRARRTLLDLLHYRPARVSPAPTTLGRQERDGYTLEKVEFSTAPGLRVPAFVLIPRHAKLPAPGLVALHDHGAFYLWGKEKLVETDDEHPALTRHKTDCYGGRSIASDLARRGYVVIVIDMFYWGERRLQLADDPQDWRERSAAMPIGRVLEAHQRCSRYEDLTARTIGAAGFTWPGVMLWDDMRTVDYLATRPEVNRSRLGCVGLSVGGFRTVHLAALDDRLRCAVAVGWMTSFPSQLRERVINTIGHSMLVPGLYDRLDFPDVAAMAMPRSLMVINGSRDGLFVPEGVQAAFRKLEACWAKCGAPSELRARLYDAPHEFNAAMQTEAWEWLDRRLK